MITRSAGFTMRSSISAGFAPGSVMITSAAGIEICGFSSRGVVSMAMMPAASDAMMMRIVSFESTNHRAKRPGRFSGLLTARLRLRRQDQVSLLPVRRP